MTDDDLLCSEADIAHMKPSDPRTICANLDAIDRILAEPATDPYEIEKE